MKKKKKKTRDGDEEFSMSDLVVSLCAVVALLFALEWDNLNRQLVEELSAMNVTTAAANQDILIFNRVTKVGSETIRGLLGALRQRNNFTAFTSLDGMPEPTENAETIFLPDYATRHRAVRSIVYANVSRPFAFVKHQNFFNFSEFGYQTPMYMNFVRHPVERIVSWYYYTRAPWYMVKETVWRNRTFLSLKKILSVQDLKMPLDECILSNRRSCGIHPGSSIGNMDYTSQVSFFCGHVKECSILESDELFNIAVKNVEQYYTVVGVLEDWDISLRVLEEFLPRFFSGVRQMLQEDPTLNHVNKNIYKPETPSSVKAMIAQKLPREIEFYHFCKQRLHKQFALIGP